jgi:hypothetical protein
MTGLTFPSADGTYHVHGLPVLRFPESASVREIAQACWDQVEPGIAARPEHYLWMYKHFRYLPSDPGAAARYPFYANPSPLFDRLDASAEPALAEAGLAE